MSSGSSESEQWFKSLPTHVQEAWIENMECKPLIDKLKQKPKVYKELCDTAYTIISSQSTV